MQGGKYGKQEVNNLKLSHCWESFACCAKSVSPALLCCWRGPLWIPLSPLQNSVTYNFCHREMMFARSLLIQFPFFIHKRRVAAVGAKFPFSGARARVARPAPASSIPSIYVYTARCVLCARVFFHPLCTHREDKMCMPRVVSDQPSLADSIFESPLFVFPQNFWENIMWIFAPLRRISIPCTPRERATDAAAETIRNLSVRRGCWRNPKPNLYDSALRLTERKGI